MNCSFCAGTSRRKEFISSDNFKIIAEKIRPHTDFLYFHLMGEPLLHPELQTLLEISNDLGYKVIITTNGTLLEKVSDILLNSPALFKVSISLHSFEANSGYCAEKYFDSCFNFADKASAKGIISVFRLWNDGGLNNLNDDIYKKLKMRFPNEWQENTKGIRIRPKLFIENGEKFEWPLHSDITTENISCFGMKDHIGILCDGSVVPCCMDYDGNAIFGNLFENELDEILSSDTSIEFSDKLKNGIAPCRMCKTCGFAQKKFLKL